MASLKSAQLFKSKGGEAVPAADLWKDGPVLVVALRRPGCREFAQLLMPPAASAHTFSEVNALQQRRRCVQVDLLDLHNCGGAVCNVVRSSYSCLP